MRYLSKEDFVNSMAYQLFWIHKKKKNDLQYGNYPENSNKLPLMMLYIQLYMKDCSNFYSEFLLLTSLPKMNPFKVHIISVNILIILQVKMNILMRKNTSLLNTTQ